MGQFRPLFVYFCLFYMTQIKNKLIKAGLEPKMAVRKSQMNPLSNPDN